MKHLISIISVHEQKLSSWNLCMRSIEKPLELPDCNLLCLYMNQSWSLKKFLFVYILECWTKDTTQPYAKNFPTAKQWVTLVVSLWLPHIVLLYPSSNLEREREREKLFWSLSLWFASMNLLVLVFTKFIYMCEQLY